MRGPALTVGVVFVLAVAAAGCGSGAHHSAQSTVQAGATTAPTTTGAAKGRSGGAPALQAEANAAAAGDIPDNQVFLVFRDAGGGFSMKYPEGWAQLGAGREVTFRDKNNIVRVVVRPGGAPTTASVHADVAALKGASLKAAPQRISVSGRPAFKLTYHTTSAPNPVTGKRVELVVDRYYLWRAGRRAIVDLGTPVGVDNVDAYRLMIESFRWS